MKLFKRSFGKKAFSLIEILVVITIIGVLTVAVFAASKYIREKNLEVKAEGDVRQIQTALGLYYNKNGRFPGTEKTSVDLTSDLCLADTGFSDCQNNPGYIYLRSLPSSPYPDKPYTYHLAQGGKWYSIRYQIGDVIKYITPKSNEPQGMSGLPDGEYFN